MPRADQGVELDVTRRTKRTLERSCHIADLLAGESGVARTARTRQAAAARELFTGRIDRRRDRDEMSLLARESAL